MRTQWKRVGQLTNRVVPAGPLTSDVNARAAVTRVRSGVQWASKRTPQFTLLAAASVEKPLIVDRHGLVTALTRNLTFAHAGARPAAKMGEALRAYRALGQLAGFVPLTWLLDGGKSRQVLVAPNIWETAQTLRLDQTDYARLVAARGFLWNSLLDASPWLAPRLLSSAASYPEGRDTLVLVASLFDRLVSAQLDRFTPRVLPSINWLREKEPPAFSRQLHVLTGMTVAELAEVRRGVSSFAEQVDLPSHPRAFWALLQDPTNMPSAAELKDPALWRGRLGYS